MSALPAVQVGLLVVSAAAVVIAVFVWLAVSGDGHSVAIEAPSSEESWQTIEYRGVEVEIPSTWKRTDTSECTFEIERWGEPESPACEFENGVTFYGSALFDPAHGPGVIRSTEDGGVTWSGYTYAGTTPSTCSTR